MASPQKQLRGTAAAEVIIAERVRKRDSEVDLSGLELQRVPESLRHMTWLRKLNLAKNNLAELPPWIGQLNSVRELSVSDNPLRELSDSLGALRGLEHLDISKCRQLGSFDEIEFFGSIKELIATGMGFQSLPPWITKLPKLRVLDISHNEMTALPALIGQLQSLERLLLQGNDLRTLPTELRALPSLTELRVDSTPHINLPTEIADSFDARKILSYYFRAIASGAPIPLNEFKLILVGRGGVGKTTLVHRLVADTYKQFGRTPGIAITKWPVTIDGEKVRAHVWDFGGQEIMHGTHRFFMTSRALYLVVITGREGSEDRDAEYWLSLVRSFAGDSPIIVLLHKWHDYQFELNRTLLREKFGKDLIFVETDSATGHGISILQQHICQLARKLPGLNAAWPAEWWQVKHELPAQRANWLTFNDFRLFCKARGVSEIADQDALAEFLHDLGLILSYRKDETLRDFGVLNPQWVTKGIYEVLNSSLLRGRGGEFSSADFTTILPSRTYPKQLHPYLLALMRKFQLCHPLDERLERYLIPELLTKEEPRLDNKLSSADCLGFVYKYGSVLPEGLIPRFIVETYVHREPQYVWRSGAVLERANCRALVRADVQGGTVTIRVDGPNSGGRRELLGIIREHFERLHRTYQKLPVTEYVPIPGHPNTLVEHDTLLTYEAARRPTITVKIGKDLRDWPVRALLDGVDLPGWDSTSRGTTFGTKSAGLLSMFVSYSRVDSVFLDQLFAALVPYERRGMLSVWAKALADPGEELDRLARAKLERSDIVILLLSNDFLSTYACMETDLHQAVLRHSNGQCEIIPVAVRACRFDLIDDIAALQPITDAGTSIQESADRDRAWHDVTVRLDRVIKRLLEKKGIR